MKIVKIIIALIFTSILFCTVFIYLKGGDIVLNYIANELKVDISYSNWCNGIDAFVLKKADLDSFKLKIPGSSTVLSCERALVEFDYSHTIDEGHILLHCFLDSPRIEMGEGVFKDGKSFMEFLPITLTSLSGNIDDLQFDRISCDLLLYGDTAEFQDMSVYSKQLVIILSGVVREGGVYRMKAKIFISPEFLAGLPEEIQGFVEMLSENGWGRFDLSLDMNIPKKFFSIEGNSIRFVMGSEEEIAQTEGPLQ